MVRLEGTGRAGVFQLSGRSLHDDVSSMIPLRYRICERCDEHTLSAGSIQVYPGIREALIESSASLTAHVPCVAWCGSAVIGFDRLQGRFVGRQ